MLQIICSLFRKIDVIDSKCPHVSGNSVFLKQGHFSAFYKLTMTAL
jgi:hypothetical protein